MSVPLGSSKNTYESALDYWLAEIQKYKDDIKKSQDNLEWSINGYIKLMKQFIKDHPE